MAIWRYGAQCPCSLIHLLGIRKVICLPLDPTEWQVTPYSHKIKCYFDVGPGSSWVKRAEARFRQGAWRIVQRPMHDSLAQRHMPSGKTNVFAKVGISRLSGFCHPHSPISCNRTTAPPRGKTRVYFHLGTLLTCQSFFAAEARGTSIFPLTRIASFRHMSDD